MDELEYLDSIDRKDGTERLKRLRQIPPDTGRFIAILAAGAPNDGEWLEIGTSGGYSTMWISLSAKKAGKKVTTYEICEEKVKIAEHTFTEVGIQNQIELVHGDFLKKHSEIEKIAFCFLDCEKHLYEKCFDVIAPKMISGGLVIADNAINHYESLKTMIEKAEKDKGFDCIVVPIGKGEFVCRRK